MTWPAVLVAAIGCLLLKALGWAAARRWLRDRPVPLALELLPVAVLATLIATATFVRGTHVGIDSRAAGVAAAALLVALRAPFLAVIVVACAVAAAVHAL